MKGWVLQPFITPRQLEDSLCQQSFWPYSADVLADIEVVVAVDLVVDLAASAVAVAVPVPVAVVRDPAPAVGWVSWEIFHHRQFVRA